MFLIRLRYFCFFNIHMYGTVQIIWRSIRLKKKEMEWVLDSHKIRTVGSVIERFCRLGLMFKIDIKNQFFNI